MKCCLQLDDSLVIHYPSQTAEAEHHIHDHRNSHPSVSPKMSIPRYLKQKYKVWTAEPACNSKTAHDYAHTILSKERARPTSKLPSGISDGPNSKPCTSSQQNRSTKESCIFKKMKDFKLCRNMLHLRTH